MARKTMTKTFDFSGVEVYKSVAEGIHNVTIDDVELKSFDSGNEGFTVRYKVISGPSKGGMIFDNYPIVETSMWKIKRLFDALNINTNGRIKIDLVKLVGKKLSVETILEEYNGKDIPRIKEMYSLASLDDGEDESHTTEDEDTDTEYDDEEEEPKAKPKSKAKPKPAKKKPEPVEEDDDEDSYEYSDDSDDEDNDEDEQPKKPVKKSSKKAKPVEEDDDEDNDWLSDDDDEDTPF